jgi:NAD(P)H-hydrate epimerase
MNNYIYSTAQVRTVEQRVFAAGVDSRDLMAQAGAAAYAELAAVWPEARSVQVLCGSGNNGGDGYVIARLASMAGCRVEVFYSSLPKTDDARFMMAQAQAAGVSIQPWAGQALIADVLVDALLGIGLNAPVTGVLADMITAINDSGLPVLAVDVPSGINADSGAICGVAVRAQRTVCFIGWKPGLLTGDGATCSGIPVLKTLDVKPDFYPVDALGAMLRDNDLRLPRRARNSHKGDFGHVLVIGGDEGMGGAVMMAAEAALRAGAGRVSVATHPLHVSALLARCPEVMVQGIHHPSQLEPLLAVATVVVIGMGLGRQAWGQRLWLAVQDCSQPLLVDADGLYWLAQQPAPRANRVLTPHPGEAARLLGIDTQAIQHDRLAAVRQLQTRYGGVALLKGAGSLVADDTTLQLCPYGNPGMATAGMGDTLAGIMGGLIGQYGMSLHTVSLAVLAHALAGDKAAEAGERGLLASDLLTPLRRLLNQGQERLDREKSPAL